MEKLNGYTIVAVMPEMRQGKIVAYWIVGHNDEDQQAMSGRIFDLAAARWDRGEYYRYEMYEGGKDQALARAISESYNMAGQAGWLRPEHALGPYQGR